MLSSCTDLSVYFFSLFSRPSCSFWCVSPLSVGASRREKAEQSLSCSLKSNRQDTAESLPLFFCTCLFFSQERVQTSADVVKRPQHTHTHTTSTHLYVLCTFMFRVQSAAHQGTFLCICILLPRPHPWFLFWTELQRGPVCAYQLIK